MPIDNLSLINQESTHIGKSHLRRKRSKFLPWIRRRTTMQIYWRLTKLRHSPREAEDHMTNIRLSHRKLCRWHNLSWTKALITFLQQEIRHWRRNNLTSYCILLTFMTRISVLNKISLQDSHNFHKRVKAKQQLFTRLQLLIMLKIKTVQLQTHSLTSMWIWIQIKDWTK